MGWLLHTWDGNDDGKRGWEIGETSEDDAHTRTHTHP